MHGVTMKIPFVFVFKMILWLFAFVHHTEWWKIYVKLHEKSKAIPLQAWTGLRVPGGRGSQISRQSAHEVSKFVSPTHRPPLSPRNIPGTHFC